MSWLSAKLKKSKRKGTGVFSWGKNKTLTSTVSLVPGVGKWASGAMKRNLKKSKSVSSRRNTIRITSI